MIKNDMFLDQYNKTWDKIKETLNIKFHSQGNRSQINRT